MACIGRFVTGSYNFWRVSLQEACAVPDLEEDPLINLFPIRQGIPNIYEDGMQDAPLNPHRVPAASCLVVASHIAEDRFYDRLKLAGVVVLGLAASALVVGALGYTAMIIIEMTMDIFLTLGLLFLEFMGETAIAFSAEILVIVLGTTAAGYELLTFTAATIVAVVEIWTKVVLPNIVRSGVRFDHQREAIRVLQARAPQAPEQALQQLAASVAQMASAAQMRGVAE